MIYLDNAATSFPKPEVVYQALDRFGLWAGGWMTIARLLRCHPWGTWGLDFVAESLPAKARWYMPWRYGRWRGTNPEPAPKIDALTCARSQE